MAAAVAAAALLVAAAVLAFQLITELRELQRVRADAAELRDVRYGLLNAEIWVERISDVLARRIDNFEVTEANRPQVKRSIERVLDRLLVEMETYMRRRNAAGDNWVERFQGQLRQGVQDLLLDFNELRARVPAYADAVIDELNRPATRAEIKTQLLAAIDEAAGATFSKTNTAEFDRVLADRGCADAEQCLRLLGAEAAELERGSTRKGLWIALAVLLLFALSASRRQVLPPEQMAMLTAATLVLLAAGVWTPMIEVDARITELRFELLGEPITFTDQVLYFQSKSILDVVGVLTETGAADMIVVAVLITLFSLVFPAAKVIAGFLYYFDLRGLRANGAVYFFALRSGKWSMADVLVVAILMAYIGFSGLVANQLSSMAGASDNVDVITTNGTALQPGFFMFLGFVLASLVLSSLLEARTGRRAT
ncbi:MAG: paraquat-inducible protein A [Thiohalocapsa sp.]|nr:paraquat-inducible protein A [Thiohalocapsa sp.]